MKKPFWLANLPRPDTATLDPERHKVGYQLVYKGQVYEIAAWRPYQRRDGTDSFVVTLASHCADCGKPFTRQYGRKLAWLTRRCTEHTRPGVLVAMTRKRAATS